MNNPKVSIIIPVYNAEKYLGQCLNSIINQTLKEIEIICINDGSTDGSPKILKEYAKKDARIKIIEQENQGAGTARNKGLDIAKGEYLQFLDADDFFEPNMCEILYDKAKQADADMVIFRAMEHNAITKQTRPYGHWVETKIYDKMAILSSFSYKTYLNDTLEIMMNTVWNKFIKSDIVRRNNIKFQNLKSCNDIYFAHASVFCSDKIVFLNEFLMTYFYLKPQDISASRGKHYKSIFLAFEEIKKILTNKGIYKQVYEQLCKSFVYHIRGEYLHIMPKDSKNFILLCEETLPKDYFNMFMKITRVRKLNFLEKIFSATNHGNYKVITLAGIEIAFKRSQNA